MTETEQDIPVPLKYSFIHFNATSINKIHAKQDKCSIYTAHAGKKLGKEELMRNIC